MEKAQRLRDALSGFRSIQRDDSQENALAPRQAAQFGVSSVPARAKDVLAMAVQAGERAEISVFGDQDSDLDLYIYDADGVLVASDVSQGDRCLCSWKPKASGEVIVEVHNLGKVCNRYEIRSN
jgi:hypothetical protein